MFGNRRKKTKSDEVGSYVGSTLAAQLMQVSAFCDIDWEDGDTSEASVIRNWAVGLVEGYISAYEISLDEVDLQRIARAVGGNIPGKDRIGVAEAIVTHVREETSRYSLSAARNNGRRILSALNQSLADGREGFVDSVSSSIADLTMLLVHSDQHTDFDQTLARAKWGDAEAQANLSRAYMHGVDVEKDVDESIRWMIKAADNGSADAQFEVARLYANGTHVEKDLVESFKWCELAEDQEHGDATYMLALNYLNGRGVEQDVSKHAPLLKLAAERGSVKAMEVVGCFHFKGGPSFEKDYELAANWLAIPAERGLPLAQCYLGMILSDSEDVGDRSRSLELLRSAARKGNKKAILALTMLLPHRDEVENGRAEAITWAVVYGHIEDADQSSGIEVIRKDLSDREVEDARNAATEIIDALPKRRKASKAG